MTNASTIPQASAPENSAAPSSKASETAPAFLVAICENFETVGYIGYEPSLTPSKDARRFRTEEGARAAVHFWEKLAGVPTMYGVVRQVQA